MEHCMEDPQGLADRYVAVWNETDAGRRRLQITNLWAPEGRHYVGAREVQGHESLEVRIRESHEKNVKGAGNRFRSMQDARRLRDVVTFRWEMVPAGGDGVLASGLEFLIVGGDDERILSDYMFIPA
jgi:hypothetical protein